MRTRFLVFAVVATLVGLAIDVYVYRRWRRFARERPRLRWTLVPLAVLAGVMPLVMPGFVLGSRWWEGGTLRGVVIGLWAFHYVPRTLIAAWLLVVDAVRGVGWIGRWIARRGATGGTDDGLGMNDMPTTTAVETRPSGVSTATAGDPVVSIDIPTATADAMSRRDAVRAIGWAAAAVPFVAVGTGLFKTVYDFEVRRLDVPIAGLDRALDGLRIVQVSDLHAGSFPSHRPVRAAFDLVLEERGDLIAITGDFVNNDAAELAIVARELPRLRAPLGVVGCLGNHDHYADVPDVLAAVRATGIDVIVNESRTRRIDGAELRIVGTDNTGFRQRFADLPAALSALPPRADDPAMRLLLAHDPTFWDLEARAAGFDLMLAGHTHGGQIGIEHPDALRWSLARLSYARWAGLYTDTGDRGPAHVYVNRGLGTTGPPLRLGIRPEVTVLTLRRA